MHTTQSPGQKIAIGAFIFFATGVVAVTGYIIAGWQAVDALYMVVITLFGVGYGEVHPIDGDGLKIFTIGVILIGCSSMLYFVGGLFQMVAEGEIEKAMGERRMNSGIDRLNGHSILCGFGRVGQMLADSLIEKDVPFVVIEKQQGRVEEAIAKNYFVIAGDASDEETLTIAGIERAKTLATVLPNDATNVFITLTAREMNRKLEIIARGECINTERKLLISGADSVVMPAAIGAMRISELISAK